MIEETFDWDAFYRDTRRLSLDARGAWLDCLYHMRLSETRGRISEPLSVYATMFGSSVNKAQRVIDEIAARKVGDCLPEADGSITIINRRMFREWQARQDANYRQAKHRGNPFIVTDGKPNENGHLEACHEIVTSTSQSPSHKKQISNVSDKKQRKKVAASRIPDPFPLTSEMTEWARINCPGLYLDSAHESFVEYWTNNTTAKAEKVDWMLTWRKGMKLALKWQQERELRGQIGRHTAPPQQYKCEECHDLGEVTVPDPDGEFSFSVKEIPCPQCRRAA